MTLRANVLQLTTSSFMCRVPSKRSRLLFSSTSYPLGRLLYVFLNPSCFQTLKFWKPSLFVMRPKNYIYLFFIILSTTVHLFLFCIKLPCWSHVMFRLWHFHYPSGESHFRCLKFRLHLWRNCPAGIRLSRGINISSCLQSFGVKTSGIRTGQWYMEAVRCPDYMALLSAAPTRSKRMHSITFRAGLAEGVAGILSVLTANGIPESTSGFLSGLTSLAFSAFAYDRKSPKV